MIIHATAVERSTVVKTINTNSYYTMANPYHSPLCGVRCSQVIPSMHAHL